MDPGIKGLSPRWVETSIPLIYVQIYPTFSANAPKGREYSKEHKREWPTLSFRLRFAHPHSGWGRHSRHS